MLAMQAKVFIGGLQLNRYRDKQRKDLLASAQGLAKSGRLPHEALVVVANQIEAMEGKMNFRFWDPIPR